MCSGKTPENFLKNPEVNGKMFEKFLIWIFLFFRNRAPSKPLVPSAGPEAGPVAPSMLGYYPSTLPTAYTSNYGNTAQQNYGSPLAILPAQQEG